MAASLTHAFLAILFLAQAASGAQIGTHEAKDGTTDAYLNIGNKPVLTNNFDPTSDYDQLSNTEFTDGNLQLDLGQGTDIISTFDGTRDKVLASNDLTFPIQSTRQEADVFKGTAGNTIDGVPVKVDAGLFGDKVSNTAGTDGMALVATNGNEVRQIDWAGTSGSTTALKTGIAGQGSLNPSGAATFGNYYVFSDAGKVRVYDRVANTIEDLPTDAALFNTIEYSEDYVAAANLPSPTSSVGANFRIGGDFFTHQGGTYFIDKGSEGVLTNKVAKWTGSAWVDDTAEWTFQSGPNSAVGAEVIEFNGETYLFSVQSSCCTYWQPYIAKSTLSPRTSIAEGLTDVGTNSRPATFVNGGQTYLVVSQNTGSGTSQSWHGFRWNSATSAWVADTAPVVGLPAGGAYNSGFAQPDIFTIATDTYMLVGRADGTVNGFKWNTGTSQWVTDAGIISGITTVASNSRTPSVFTMGGTTYLIIGKNTGYDGYTWTGSAWTTSTSIITGLPSSSNGFAEYLTVGGSSYVVIGEASGFLTDYKWGGSSWAATEDLIAPTNLDIGANSAPTVVSIGGEQRFVIGENNGVLFGYIAQKKYWANLGSGSSNQYWDMVPFTHAGSLYVFTKDASGTGKNVWLVNTATGTLSAALEAGLSSIALTSSAYTGFEAIPNANGWDMVSIEQQKRLKFDATTLTWSLVPMGEYGSRGTSSRYDQTVYGVIGSTTVFGGFHYPAGGTDTTMLLVHSLAASSPGIAVGELDGRGLPEIVVYSFGGLKVFSKTDGTWQAIHSEATTYTTVTIGDYNGDLKQDLLVREGTGAIYALSLRPLGLTERVQVTAAGAYKAVVQGGVADQINAHAAYSEHGALIGDTSVTLTGEPRRTASTSAGNTGKQTLSPLSTYQRGQLHHFNVMGGTYAWMRWGTSITPLQWDGTEWSPLTTTWSNQLYDQTGITPPANHQLMGAAAAVMWYSGTDYYAAVIHQTQDIRDCLTQGYTSYNNRYAYQAKGFKFNGVTGVWDASTLATTGIALPTSSNPGITGMYVTYIGTTPKLVLGTWNFVSGEMNSSCNNSGSATNYQLLGRTWNAGSGWASDSQIVSFTITDPTNCPATTCANSYFAQGADTLVNGNGKTIMFNQASTSTSAFEWTGSSWVVATQGPSPSSGCIGAGNTAALGRVKIGSTEYVTESCLGRIAAGTISGTSYVKDFTISRGLWMPTPADIEAAELSYGSPITILQWGGNFAEGVVQATHALPTQCGCGLTYRPAVGLFGKDIRFLELVTISGQQWAITKEGSSFALHAYRNTVGTTWVQDDAKVAGLAALNTNFGFEAFTWEGTPMLAQRTSTAIALYTWQGSAWSLLENVPLVLTSDKFTIHEDGDVLVLANWGTAAGAKLYASRDAVTWKRLDVATSTLSSTFGTTTTIGSLVRTPTNNLQLIHVNTVVVQLYQDYHNVFTFTTLSAFGQLFWDNTGSPSAPDSAATYDPSTVFQHGGRDRIITWRNSDNSWKSSTFTNGAWVEDNAYIAGLPVTPGVTSIEVGVVGTTTVLFVQTTGSPWLVAYEWSLTTWSASTAMMSGITGLSSGLWDLSLFTWQGSTYLVRHGQYDWKWTGTTWTSVSSNVIPYFVSAEGFEMFEADGKLWVIRLQVSGSTVYLEQWYLNTANNQWAQSTAQQVTITGISGSYHMVDVLTTAQGSAVYISFTGTGSEDYTQAARHSWRPVLTDATVHANSPAYAAGCTIRRAALGDFNADGYPDVAAVCTNDLVVLMVNDEKVLTTQNIGTSPGGQVVYLADLDGDRTVEVIVAGTSFVDVYGVNGAGTWVKEGTVTLPAGTWRGFTIVAKSTITGAAAIDVDLATISDTYAFAVRNSDIKYKAITGGGGGAWQTGPTVSGTVTALCAAAGNLYIGRSDGTVVAYAAGAGATTALDAGATVAVSSIWCGDEVVIGYTNGGLKRVSTGGALRWGPVYPEASSVVSIVVHAGTQVYAATANAKLVQVDYADGDGVWGTFGTSLAKVLNHASPASMVSTGSSLAVCFSSGDLEIYSTSTGAYVDGVNMGLACNHMAMAAGNEFILVGHTQGHIAKVRLDTLVVEWGVKGAALDMPLGTAPWRNEWGSSVRTIATGQTWVKSNGDSVITLDSQGSLYFTDLAYYEPLRIFPTHDPVTDPFSQDGLPYGIAFWDAQGPMVGLTVVMDIIGATTNELTFYYEPRDDVYARARFVQGGDLSLLTQTFTLEDFRDAASGSFTSAVLGGYYTVDGASVMGTTTGGATYAIEWRSGTTPAYAALSWTEWTTGVPEPNPYYQYKITMSRNPAITTSGVTISEVHVDYSVYAASGTAELSWDIGANLARYVALDASEVPADDATVTYYLRGSNVASWIPATPGLEVDLGFETDTVYAKVAMTRAWDSSKLQDLSIQWRATGETKFTNSVTRNAGSASEINTVSVTPTQTFGNSIVAIPVSDKVSDIIEVKGNLKDAVVGEWPLSETAASVTADNIVVNNGFETYSTSPGMPSSWTVTNGASGNFARETLAANVHSGSNAVAITMPATPASQSLGQTVATVAGQSYLFCGWFKTSGGAANPQMLIRNTVDSINAAVIEPTTGSTTWAQSCGTFVAQAGKTYSFRAMAQTSTTGDKVYVDDMLFAPISAIDYSGYSLNGILQTTASEGPQIGVTANVGTAYDFDGSNDYVQVSDNSALDVTDDITIEAWIRPDLVTAGSRDIIRKDSAYLMGQDGAAIRFLKWTGASTTSVSTGNFLVANTWHHIVATYDGANVVVYNNGAQVYTSAMTGAMDASTGNLKIGSAGSSNFFNGLIRGARVYNQVASPDQVADLYAGSIPATIDSSLVEVNSLSAVRPGAFYFDPDAKYIYVGAKAENGVGIIREIRASFGSDFDFVMPTFLRSGDYMILTGVLRDAEGLPVENLVAEVTFLKNGVPVYGPIRKYIAGGNIEAAISTNPLAPGVYDVEVTFRDTNEIVFTSTNELIIGQSTSTGGGGGGTIYADATANFHFFDADTGFGLDSNFLKVLATDDGDEPTSVDRVIDNRLPTATGQTIKFRVEDYWGQKVYPEGVPTSASFGITSVSQFVDVGLDLANFKIKNTNSSVVHFHINKVGSGATISEYILPQEIVDFNLVAGAYHVELDYYNSITGAFQNHVEEDITVTTDTFYWIKGHDLADIIIEINNVGVDLENQIVNVGVNVNNIQSTIGNQVTNVQTSISNLQSSLTTQITSVLTEVTNSETTITNQINALESVINNFETDITNQVNTFQVSVTNQLTTLGTQVNAISTQITNLDTGITTQINTIQFSLENHFKYRDETQVLPGQVGHWTLNEVMGQGTNAVTNGGFEDYPTSPGAPTGWTTSAATATRETGTGLFSAGVNALKVTRTATGGTSSVSSATFTLVAGKSYEFTYDARSGGSYDCHAKLRNTSDSVDITATSGTSTSNSWKRFTQTFQAIAGKNYQIQAHANNGGTSGQFCYFDNVNVRELYANDEAGTKDGALGGAANAVGPTIGVAAKGRTGYQFDGTNDYIEMPNLDVGYTSPLSVAFWAKGTEQVQAFAHQFQLHGNNGLHTYVVDSTGNLNVKGNFGSGNLDNQLGPAGIGEDGLWHHIILTYDGASVKGYVDGALTNTYAFTGAIAGSSPGKLFLGSSATTGSNFYTGTLDDFHVYDRALVADDVSYLYNAGTPIQQFNNVNFVINNNAATVTNQLNTISTAINNNDASIDTQLNTIYSTLTNNQAAITTQVNTVITEIENTETDLEVQINALSSQVTNSGTTIGNQINAVSTQITNLDTGITNQLNTLNFNIDNRFQYRDQYQPLPGQVAHWGLNEVKGQGTNLVANGGFETYITSPGVPDNWQARGATGGTTVTRETSIKQAGANSAKLVVDWNTASVTGHGIQQTISGLTVGKSYYVEGWMYAPAVLSSGTSATMRLRDTTPACCANIYQIAQPATGNIGSWQKVAGTFEAITGQTYMLELDLFRSSAGTGIDTLYFDSFTVQELVADNLAATTAGDAVLKNAPLNVPGATLGVQGHVGSAYQFDGVNDYMQATFDNTVLRAGQESQDWAIEAWFQPKGAASSGDSIIVGKLGFHGGILQGPGNSGRDIECQMYDVNNVVTRSVAYTLPDSNMHHLAMVYDDRVMTCYVDGVSRGTATMPANGRFEPGYSTTLNIGGDGTTRFVNGIIDEVIAYDRALTPQEVSFRYTADAPFYQYNNLNVLVNNQGSSITTQLNTIATAINNNDASIDTQLNTIYTTLTNNQAAVTSQVNQVLTEIANTQSDLEIQINEVETQVTNSESNIGTQINGIVTQITNLGSSVTTQFNTLQFEIDNHFAYRDQHAPLPGQLAHWPLDELAGVGAELVTNPSFESYTTSPGAPTGWSVGGDDTATRENTLIQQGTNALKLVCGATGTCSASQSIPVTTGKSYLVEAWGRTNGGASESAMLLVRNTAGNDPIVAQTATASTTYTRLYGTFTAVAGQTYTLHVREDSSTLSGGETVYFDRISVKEVTADDVVGTFDGDLDGGVTGTPRGGPTVGQTGKFGGSYDFDGVNDVVNIEGFSLPAARTGVAIEAWVNFDSITGEQRIVSHGGGTLTIRKTTAHKLDFHWATEGTVSTDSISGTTTVVAGQWYHIVGTHDGLTAKVYVNGVEEGSKAAQLSTSTFSNVWQIGAGGTNTMFVNGRIDDVHVYDRALRGDEVQFRYNAGTPVQQFNNLNFVLNNNDASIDAQLNTISTAINNNDASIDTQLNTIYTTVANNHATLSTQVNNVLTELENTEADLEIQINAVSTQVSNTGSTLGTQINGVTTQITNLDTSVQTQFNTLNFDIDNHFAYRDQYQPLPGQMGHWAFNEVRGQGQNVVANPGFETYATSPGVPASWTQIGGATGITLAKDTTVKYADQNGLKVTANWASAPLASTKGVEQVVSLTAGKSYYFEGWMYLHDAFESTEVAVCKVRNQSANVDVVTAVGSSAVVGSWVKCTGTFYVAGTADYRLQAGLFKTTGATGTTSITFDGFFVQEIYAEDLTESGRNGVLQGATNMPGPGLDAPGKMVAAYQFDGVDDRVVLPTLPTAGLNAISAEAWFTANTWTPTGSFQGIIGDTSDELTLFHDKALAQIRAKVLLTTGSVNVGFATSGITTGVYHHAAAVYDGAALRLYIDGAQVASTNAVGIMLKDATVAIGGQEDGTDPWGGRIDEVVVYGRALTADEVSFRYSAGSPVQQFNSLNFVLNNNQANLQTQLNSISTTINNNDASIDTQLNTIYSTVTNNQAAITSQVNQVLTEIENTEADLEVQINSVSTQVSNTGTTIGNQITGVSTQITNLDSDITTQFNTLMFEVENQGSTIQTQINSVQTSINNNDASIDSQLNTISTAINNNDASIDTQLNTIYSTVTNNQAAITSQVNQVITEIENTEADIEVQINAVQTAVTNSGTTIQNQVNAVSTQITNLDTSVATQFNTLNFEIDNHFSYRDQYQPLAGTVAHWGLNEDNGQGASIVANGGFESYATTPGIPPSWSEYTAATPNTAYTRESSIIQSGTNAVKMTADGVNGLGLIQELTTVAGKSYYVEGYARTGGSGQAFLAIRSMTDSGTVVLNLLTAASTTEYTKLSGVFYAEAGKSYRLQASTAAGVPAAGQVVYFDAIIVQEIYAEDLSEGGLNGALRGAALTAAPAINREGKTVTAYDFDGTDDSIEVADNSALDLTTGLTIEAWVKPDVTSGTRPIVWKQGAYGMYQSGTSLIVRTVVAGASRQDSYSGQLAVGTWAHVAMTYDAVNQCTYVNGVSVGCTARTGSLDNSANPLRMGASGIATEYFDGRIDEVVVYGRALSADEVKHRATAATTVQQFNTLNFVLNNNQANLQTQLNTISTTINNNDASIDTQLNTIYSTVTNNQAAVTTQINQVLSEIENTEADLELQINNVEAEVTNQGGTITSQVNAVSTQITNLGTSVTSQFNTISVSLENVETSITNQVNSVSVQISNLDADIETQVNQIMASISNSNTNIVSQLNVLKTLVENTASSITTQFNGVTVQLTNVESNLVNQITFARIDIQDVNTTIQNRIEGMNATLLAEMTGLLDNMNQRSDELFDQTVSVLASIAESESALSGQLLAQTTALLDNVTVRSDAILNKTLTVLDNLALAESNLTAELHLRAIQILTTVNTRSDEIFNSTLVVIESLPVIESNLTAQIHSLTFDVMANVTVRTDEILNRTLEVLATLPDLQGNLTEQINLKTLAILNTVHVRSDEVLGKTLQVLDELPEIESNLTLEVHLRTLEILDQVDLRSDEVFDSTLDVLVEVQGFSERTNNQFQNVSADVLQVVSSVLAVQEAVTTNITTTLRDVQGEVISVSNRLDNRTADVLAALEFLQNSLGDANFTGVTDIVQVVATMRELFSQPHTVYVPAFNYTGLANDQLPPTSSLDAFQAIGDERAVIVRWLAKDNILVKDISIWVREGTTGEWEPVGTFASSGGDKVVGGLEKGTEYHFRAQATDMAGNVETLPTDERQPNFATITVGEGARGGFNEFQPPADARGVFTPAPQAVLVGLLLLGLALLLRRRQA